MAVRNLLNPDFPPVAWRHDGAGGLLLTGGLTWETPGRFSLEFGARRISMLKDERAAWEAKIDAGAWYLEDVAWFFDEVIGSLESAITEAHAWRTPR